MSLGMRGQVSSLRACALAVVNNRPATIAKAPRESPLPILFFNQFSEMRFLIKMMSFRRGMSMMIFVCLALGIMYIHFLNQ